MRGRFVLRHEGGPAPDADVERIAALAGAVVVDRSPRVVLVEAEEEPLRALARSMPGWVMAPEQTIAVPDTRKQVRRPPAG